MAKNESRKRRLSQSQALESEEGTPLPERKKQLSKSQIEKDFSEVEFKFLLRDPKTLSEGLEKFIKCAEGFGEGVISHDVVAGFCRSSPTCVELFTTIESNTKLHEATLVFQCFEIILTRIRTDLPKLSSTGEAIAQRMLASHLGLLYNCLREQNKSKTIKSALQLLIAMVMLSDKARRAVQTRLNFGHQNFPALFRRRNRKDPQDVRSCMVLLTLAFVLDSDHSVINALVQQKTFLQQTLTGLRYDTRDVVLDVLATLLDKVVKCPGVNKTAKIKLFSEYILRQLCDLFRWEGPRGWVKNEKKKGRRKEEEVDTEMDTDNETLTEEREAIASVSYDFLVELCCSQKYGVNFFDRSYGIEQGNKNQLLSHLLEWLVNRLGDDRVSNLVVHIVQACPDQIRRLLTHMVPMLYPRWSDKWAMHLDFVISLYDGLLDCPSFLTSKGVHMDDRSAMISMASVFCLPPAKVAAVLTQSVKHEDERVQHKGLQLLCVLVRKAVTILKALTTNTEEKNTRGSEISLAEDFVTAAVKVLPQPNLLFACVDRILARLEQESKASLGKESSADTSVDIVEHTVVLLRVLSLYQSLIPTLLSDRPRDLAKVVDMVGKLPVSGAPEADGDDDVAMVDAEPGVVIMANDNKVDDEKKWLPQLCLLKLLSETDARKIAFGRESLLEKLLISASLSGKHRDVTMNLICKILQNMDVFQGHGRELEIWIAAALTRSSDHLRTARVENQTLSDLTFLAHCLSSLINNPTPYVDRMAEAVADGGTSGQDLDTSSVGTNESAIEDVLLMEDEQLDALLSEPGTVTHQQKGQQSRHPFSPLVLVALDYLQHNKTVDAGMRSYVSAVLVKLLHVQTWPATFCAVVLRSEATLADGVRAYVQAWMPEIEDTVRAGRVALDSELVNRFTSGLMDLHSSVHTQTPPATSVDFLTKLAQDLSPPDRLVGLSQILLYITDFVSIKSRISKEGWSILDMYCEVAVALFGIISPLNKDDRDYQNQEKILSSDGMTRTAHTPLEAVSERVPCHQAKQRESLAALKLVLLHPVLKGLFLSPSLCSSSPVKAKSPLKGKKNVKNSRIVSTFLCNILVRCKNLVCGIDLKNVLQEYLAIVMDRLSRFNLLSPEFQNICVKSVQAICHQLDLVPYSHCLTQLLALSLETFVTGADGGEAQSLSLVGNTLLTLMNGWLHKIQDASDNMDSFFVRKAQRQEQLMLNASPCVEHQDIISEAQLDIVKKNCMKIQCTFDFEISTKIQMAQLSPFFDLLSRCHDSDDLDRCALSILTLIPGSVLACSPSLCGCLQSAPHTLTPTRKQVLGVLVKSKPEMFNWCKGWLQAHNLRVVKRNLWWLVTYFLQAPVSSTEKLKTLEALKAVVSPLVVDLVTSKDEDKLTALLHLCRAMGSLDLTFQQSVLAAVADAVNSHSDVGQLHLDILTSAAHSWASAAQTTTLTTSHHSPFALVLKVTTGHLTFLTSKKSTRHTRMENLTLDVALDMIPRLQPGDTESLRGAWAPFVKNTLRSLYTNEKLLRVLSKLVPYVYSSPMPGSSCADESQSDRKDFGLSAHTMFQMCINHTAFLSTILSENANAAKDALVKLLLVLCEAEPTCYQASISSVLIGAYSATLSLTDQTLLFMMKKCSETTAGAQFECPLLWGQSALEHRSVSQVLGPSLDAQTSVKSVLGQLDEKLMKLSILHYPLTRRQNADGGLGIGEAAGYKSRAGCYDPCFLLNLFRQILSPDKLVPIRLFVEKDCLSYLLIALSSHDHRSRLLAYQALNNFYTHAEGSKCHERTELTYLLDLLNASRSKDDKKLPFLLALFFSRAVKLALYPADPVYMSIFRFLMAKPQMDLASVPEFYQLFFSANIQHKQERAWILSLIADGMRETSDYRLLQRHFIFKIILAFYDSTISDAHTRGLVLRTVRNACHETKVAVDLVKNHGLLLWLATAVAGLSRSSEHVSLLCDVIHTLWSSLTAATSRPPGPDGQYGRPEGGAGDGKNRDTPKQESSSDDDDDDDDGDDNIQDGDGDGVKKVGAATLETQILNTVKKAKALLKGSVSVPKSTLVELGLIVKSLLPHLRKCPAHSVVKILKVMCSLLSHCVSVTTEEKQRTSACRHATQEPASLGKEEMTSPTTLYLPLSSEDLCMLLCAVARVTGHDVVAKQATETLKKLGLDYGVGIAASQSDHHSPAYGKTLLKESSCEQDVGVDGIAEDSAKGDNENVVLEEEHMNTGRKTIEEKEEKPMIADEVRDLFLTIVHSTSVLKLV